MPPRASRPTTPMPASTSCRSACTGASGSTGSRLSAGLRPPRRPADEGAALGNLGLAWADLGEPRRAIEHLRAGTSRSRARSATGAARATRSAIWASPGRTSASRGGRSSSYEQHLAIAREIGDRRGEGNALGNLGLAWADLGRAAAGDRALRAAPRDRARDRRPARRGQRARQSGHRLGDLGEPRRAIEHHEQHLAIAREIGDRLRRGQRAVQLGLGARCSWRAGRGGAAGARGARHLRGDRGQAPCREGARAAGRVGCGGRAFLRHHHSGSRSWSGLVCLLLAHQHPIL